MNRADINPVSAIFPFVGDFGKPIMVAIQKIYVILAVVLRNEQVNNIILLSWKKILSLQRVIFNQSDTMNKV